MLYDYYHNNDGVTQVGRSSHPPDWQRDNGQRQKPRAPSREKTCIGWRVELDFFDDPGEFPASLLLQGKVEQ
jgi:hypothetical protein